MLIGIVLSVDDSYSEILERTAYLIIAAAAPNAADNLDVIPVLGSYLNATIDGGIAAAGMWVVSFAIAVINRIKP